MVGRIPAATVKEWLREGGEIAVLDVREHGQYGEGHLFHATPVLYSRFEPLIETLVPRRSTRIVVYDDGDGVAECARTRAEALGYSNVSVLDGGTAGWASAGNRLFAGVNVPSKTFGELVEHAYHVPTVSAEELEERRRRGDKLIVIDGRPIDEYRKFNIPGGICCPNGELAYRIEVLAPDPDTTIVVNCAGRTRSIVGAQLLRSFGVENRVVALRNGTQGWCLAGLALEHGADRAYPAPPEGARLNVCGSKRRRSAPATALRASRRKLYAVGSKSPTAPPTSLTFAPRKSSRPGIFQSRYMRQAASSFRRWING